MRISHKQAKIAKTIRAREENRSLLIGSVGTSKTFGATVAMLLDPDHTEGSAALEDQCHERHRRHDR